jgi:ABC-2 type transport system permease protein
MSPPAVTAELTSAELREIRGPRVLGRDPRRFWRLLWHLARFDFKLKYAGSVFGYLWSLVGPLVLFGVLYLAFTRIVRFGTGVENYAVVLLFNIMLFQFFAEATSRSLSSIVAREPLVRKMEFPRLAIPLSVVLASTFGLAIDLIVVIGFALAAGVPVTATWLLIPVLVLWLYAFTVGASFLLATLYVRFRDIIQIWQVLSRAMFYGSPVLFPIELFPTGWKPLLLLNPLAPLFAQARVWFVDPGAPSYAEAMGGGIYWIYPTLILVTVIALGIWYFGRETPRAAEAL